MSNQSRIYHITTEFLDALRTEKRLMGVDKHVQIQTILTQLSEETDAETLKLTLIPLIAQSPQEQAQLYATFEQAVKRLDRVTQQLRNRAQSETQRLDMVQTVNATIQQGGLPTFKYKKQTRPTDYLLLIDRQSVRNHRAQLFDSLYAVFKAQEVEIARFFYDSDVRVCYSEDYPHGIALADVQQRYYQSRLLIVGTGGQLLNPMSGKAAAWTAVFKQWKDRALFSPKPLTAWGYDERQLSALFTTLPATLQGLGFWVEEVNTGADARFDNWADKIDDVPNAPIVPDDADPLPILDLYFEPNTVKWIAACAIYPTLHWDLTLWLGQSPLTPEGGTLREFNKDGSLKQLIKEGTPNEPTTSTPPSGGQGGLSTFANLMQICRLSWFVNGEMPDETRTALLHYLEQNDAPLLLHLRNAIAEELQRNPPPTDSAAYDKFRLNIALNRWLTTTDAQKKKELEAEVADLLAQGAEPDFTVLKYLNAPRTALDFIVPDDWKKFVHPSGFAALGWLKAWKEVVLGAILLVLGLVGIFYPYQFKTFDCSKEELRQLVVNDTTRYFCLDNSFNRMAYHEQFVHKLIEERRFNDTAGFTVPNKYATDSILLANLLNVEVTNLAGTPILRLFYECRSNIAVDLYRSAEKFYQNNKKDSACLVLEIAAKLDSLDKDIKVAQAFLCGKVDKKARFDIAPIIRGRVMSSSSLSVLTDDSGATLTDGENILAIDGENAMPLADVQITGAGVNTRTDAQGNYLLKLPPQYPSDKIALTFTKYGYSIVNQTFTIDKIKQLATVSLVPNATKPSETPKKDTPIAKPPIVNTPSVLTPKDSVNAPILVPVMVAIKGGTFQMGSDDKIDNIVQPLHNVTLSDFFIGKHEVTNAQFCQFLNDKGNQTEDEIKWVDLERSVKNETCRIQTQGKGFIVEKGYENYPIIWVNHYGATAYAQWLGNKTGKKYRLPTEAEWEYAARGGIKSKGFTYSGSNTVSDVAWYDQNSDMQVHPVGGKQTNELGLYDMSGNLFEWCSDWYEQKYYKKSAAQNPKGAELGYSRVFRGGSFVNNAWECRVVDRYNEPPTRHSENVGFRVAMSPQ